MNPNRNGNIAVCVSPNNPSSGSCISTGVSPVPVLVLAAILAAAFATGAAGAALDGTSAIGT